MHAILRYRKDTSPHGERMALLFGLVENIDRPSKRQPATRTVRRASRDGSGLTWQACRWPEYWTGKCCVSRYH